MLDKAQIVGSCPRIPFIPPGPCRQGLTLVELVLALAIMALVMSTVYGSFRGTGRSLQGLSVRNELYRSVSALLDEISREVVSAYLSTNNFPANGRAVSYFWIEDKESHDMPQDNLFFTTYGHAYSLGNIGEAGQSEVCYTVRYNQKREELVLLKKEDPTPDEITCKDEDLDDWDAPYGERSMPVATGIHPERGKGYRLVGFQVECEGQEKDKPIYEWDTDQSRRLPHNVTITITYEDANGQVLPFSKRVRPQLMLRNR